MKSAIIASLHYLGFAVALGSVFGRGLWIKKLKENSEASALALRKVFFHDNLWGISALVIIVTGLMRAFGGLEKGTQYYLQNPHFHAKLGLFGLIFILELFPMILFIKWRIQRKKGVVLFSGTTIKKLWIINHLELILIILIPFIASFMARGL